MKDLVITHQRLRREARVLALCMLLSIGLNVAGILSYSASWGELLTSWHLVLGLTLALYLLLCGLRMTWALLRHVYCLIFHRVSSHSVTPDQPFQGK